MRNFVYPVYESEEESWDRFLKTYNLIDKLVGMDVVVPVSTHDIMQAWRDILVFMACNRDLLNGVDYMHEAIYHIRYRVFSENISESNELMLVLLIEEELCRCGYAFHVWSNMREFQTVYQELLFPRKNSRGCRAFCPWYMEMYLAGNMANRIMLKNKRPIDWGDELDCNWATFPYGPDYMRYRVTVCEQAMDILFPESDQWYEEWMDAQYIAERIKERYKMDLTKDKSGYDDLISLVIDRKYPKRCSVNLYRLGNVTPDLLERLWGEKAHEMLQKCFLDIFSRYKAAKKTCKKRSSYSRQAVMQSWLYQWVKERKEENDPMLSQKTKQALFHIEMNF